MPAPPGLAGALAKKYQILQQQADSTGALQSAQATGIANSQASENALRAAQANATAQQGDTYGPLAQSQIGLQGAQAGYLGTQSKVLGNDLTPTSDGFARALATQYPTTQRPGGNNGWTDPNSLWGSFSNWGSLNVPAGPVTSQSRDILNPQLHAKGTANVRKSQQGRGGRAQMAPPRPSAAPQPMTSMPPGPMGAFPAVSPPQGLPGLAGMLHAASGMSRVAAAPKLNYDPTMMGHGAAVVMGPGYADGGANVPAPGQTVTGGSWTGPTAPSAPPAPLPPTPLQGGDLRRRLGMGVVRAADGATSISPMPGNQGSWSGPVPGPTAPAPPPPVAYPVPSAPTPGGRPFGKRINAASGATSVPGQMPPRGQNTDVVPAMLTPGEAVVNREGVKHLPGGRQAVSKANAKGLEDRRKGTGRGMVKKGGPNHVAIHVKMG